MSDAPNPLLTRVRNGLAWPPWDGWSDAVIAPTETVEVGPIDHESRMAAVRRRIALATTIEQGGPYIEVFAAQALQRLENERGTDIGPLGSFTFAIKDLLAIEGKPMMAGSAVRSDAQPEPATAPMINRLEALGAVAVGTVTLHEFAFGVTGINKFSGTAPNPAALDRITGGSSSGSAAAVANGSARIAIGTDTGGSVRIPASFCGIVGYKPSFGLYPSAGVFALSGTLDHVGLFAASMQDIVTTHAALGYPTMAQTLPPRVGIARGDIEAADPDVQELMKVAIDALEAAGCEMVDVAWPDAEKTLATSTAIMFSEAAAIHADSLERHSDRYGADIKARLELGANLSAVEVATAHELRRQLIAQVSQTLQTAPVIISPTTPMAAPLISEAGDRALAPRIVANTRLGNVLGMPAVSLPLPANGPPVGLQVLGFDDAAVLGHASAIENVLANL